MNIWTVLLLIGIVLAMVGALLYALRHRLFGGCGGDCSRCGYGEKCKRNSR